MTRRFSFFEMWLRMGAGLSTRRCVILAMAAACGLLNAGPLFAQRDPDAFLNQQRLIEDQVRAALDKELPAEQKVDIDWGGWYSFYLFLYDDGINSSRTYRQHDLRAWTSVSLEEGTHQFYARGKLQYQDFNTGDSYDGNDNDWVGPNLDRGFYQFDLQRAMRAYAGQRIDWNFKAKVGRDLVEFGTGYALSLPMDHVLLTLDVGDLEIQGLAGTTIRSMDDIDLSRPNSGDSERNFWGTQMTYTGLEKHKPFIYAFWNEDQHRDNFRWPPQGHDYDTWYIGLGSMGEIARHLRYMTEWVFEGGKSYRWGQWDERNNVCAWAFDAGLEYLSPGPMKPRYSFEYMFASGDPDRPFSPTDALGGNTRGNDTSFVGFGYRYTGLALAPRLSNLHIWRAGASFLPFEKIEALRELEVGTDWFLYSKNHSAGAISDYTADERSGYVGWEMDYYVNWRLTSDLAWTTRFGTFFPGQSYSDQTTRTFLMTGMTYSF